MDHGALKFLLAHSAQHAVICNADFQIVAASSSADKGPYKTGSRLEDLFDLTEPQRARLQHCMQSTVKKRFQLHTKSGQNLMVCGGRLGKPFNTEPLMLLELQDASGARAKFKLTTQTLQIDRRAQKLQHKNTALTQQNLRLMQKASTDGMTGLLNRSAFDDILKAQVANNVEFGLLYLDLNNLKRINDELGHRAGDETIRAVARCLQTTIRRTDCAARIGGDEFAILLTCMIDQSAMRSFCSRLCSDIERSPENRARAASHKFSVAIGAAIWPQDSAHLSAILSSADQAMYVSKRSKVEVVFASDLDDTNKQYALL